MSVSIGIVGAGAIAREHVAALNQIGGIRVGIVISQDPERGRALAAQAGGAAYSRELAELWSDPAISAVDICARPKHHPELAIAAAQHGKAALVEKPAALSLAEFDRMVATASSTGTSLMIGQSTRFQPVHLEMAAAIASGEIGQPRVLHGTWWAGHTWPGGWRAWQLDPEQSGGQLLHNGSHPVDLALWLLGAKPERVFARAWRSFASGMPTPDSFNLTLRCEGGALALLEWSYALPKRGDYLRRVMISGDDGSLQHSTEFDAPQRLSDVPVPSLAAADGIRHELEHWVATLRGEAEPVVKNSEVRAALATTIAAQLSLDSGRPVEIAQVEA